MDYRFDERELQNLRAAIRRNPNLVIAETGKFLKRGIAAYKRTIDNNPWRMGGAKGGVPRDTGNLRESHTPPIYSRWEARIEANRTGKAPYAVYVHEGTWKMKGRPWLDHAKRTNQGEIQKYERDLLDEIAKDLTR